MDKNTDSEKYFHTENFYLACFCFAKGLELANIEKEPDSRKSTFVFIDSPERELLVHSFNFAKEDSKEVLLDFRKAVVAIKALKDKLYSGF